LFPLYPPVTRQRRWRYILDDSSLLWSCRFPKFPDDSFNFFPVTFLLVQSHHAEIIVVKRLIQGRNNTTKVGVEPRSCDHDHAADNEIYMLQKMLNSY